jgi:uncharacterized membrane protein
MDSMTTVISVLVVVAAVGSGLVGGLFVAFSVAVMPALRRLPPAHGVAVMRMVNRVILNPLFLLLFVGTAVVCAAVVVLDPGNVRHVVGAALYVVGTFVATMAVNVPLNNALDTADPEDAQAWERFHPRWTAWNQVRALAATVATVLLTIPA